MLDWIRNERVRGVLKLEKNVQERRPCDARRGALCTSRKKGDGNGSASGGRAEGIREDVGVRTGEG